MSKAPERIWVGVSELGDLAINHKGEKLNGYDHVEYARADRIEALTAERDAWKEQHAAEALGLHAQMQRAEAAEAKLAQAVDWFETIRDRAKGDYMAHTYYLDALAALATIKRREP